MTFSISVDLAAAFFAHAEINSHAIELYSKTPPLMDELRKCANRYWDFIWWKETYSQRRSREAIGNFRFYHPAAIQAYTGLPFSEKALASLENVPFSSEKLESYSGRGSSVGDFALIADPGLSILQMRRLIPQEFYHGQHHYEHWECARRKDPPAWILLSTDLYFRGCQFAEQDRKRKEEGDLLIPSARRTVFALLMLKLFHGTRHFYGTIVRTSDTVLVSEERRVTAGYDVHARGVGICIDTWQDHVSSDRIGIGLEVSSAPSIL
ncbi:MAG: hypothetical protein PHN33_03975 [Candidatus Peribacteraceae bacterium]|nr:hypothetical protein [Candidatus Peribacteraceae bacterium]